MPPEGNLMKTSAPREHSRRSEDGSRRVSQWVDSDDDDEPALYCTNDFRMRVMKVLRCSKKYCHDWTRCPFAHPGEKATRRDPRLGVYTGIACPDMRRDQRCPRGHYCPYAHNVFEYWLHPTRYRTALCRDVERCSRKICFFAHEVHEIRTNVERPYVSPEQLVAATEAAAMDPRVQAEFQAAKEQSSSSKAGNLGMFHTLDDPSDVELPNLPDAASMTLTPPWASQENQAVSNAFSTLMRGSAGPLPYTYKPQLQSGSQLGLATENFRSVPPHRPGTFQGSAAFAETGSLAIKRSISDPASASGRGSSQEDQRENPSSFRQDLSGLLEESSEVRRTSAVNPGVWQQKEEQQTSLQSTSRGWPVSAVDEKVQGMFPSHLNTMVQLPSHQSWGGQQNLINAAAHLMEGKEMGRGLWSTPRGPLENPLYSTSSSISERQAPAESPLANRLDSVYKQKLRKRQVKRQQARDGPGRFGYAQPYTPQPPIFASKPNLYSQYSSSTPKDPYPGAPTSSFWSDTPPLDYNLAYQQQQQQAAQQATYLQEMKIHQQQQQQQQQQLLAYEQMEARFQLHQAIEHELRKLSEGSGGAGGMGHSPQSTSSTSKPAQVARPSIDTSFDLRYNPPFGEHQGLYSDPKRSSPIAQSGSLHGQLNSLYSDTSLAHTGHELAGYLGEPHSSVLNPRQHGKEPLFNFTDSTIPIGDQQAYQHSSDQSRLSPQLEDIFTQLNMESPPKLGSSSRSPADTGRMQNDG